MGGGIGTEALCIIVFIGRSNLTSPLQKTQLLVPESPSTRLESSEQNGQLTMLELSKEFILPAFDIIVQSHTIRLKGLDSFEMGFESHRQLSSQNRRASRWPLCLPVRLPTKN